MLAEEWERIKHIFDAALNLPEAERSGYLDLTCSPEMRQVIDELIAGDKSAENKNFLPDESLPWRQRVFTDGALVAGRFRVIRFIACGGMGEVYEAFDERLRLRIAIKTLRPELIIDAEAIGRFQREIRIARGVAQENLCRVYDLVEHRFPDAPDCCVPCLTMQLLEGESLLSYLHRNRPVPAAVALPLIRQIAAALDCLHQNGIVHRDLKPSNIMLVAGEEGELQAVVTDFGLAKLTSADEIFESRTRFQIGAPYFMAPEILRGERPGAASDIYAFGLIVDEIITRSSAFTATSVQALYYSKLWEKPIPTESRADGIPRHWPAVIAKCLELDPKARYLRASDAVSNLETPLPFQLLAVSAQVYRTVAAAIQKRKVFFGFMVTPVLLGVFAMTEALMGSKPADVVVAPFENISSDKSLDYLCRGTSSELVKDLSRMPNLRTFTAASRQGKPAARFLLSGEMQAYNGQMRLTVTLTDTKDSSILWSDSFGGSKLENTLQLQNDIAFSTVSEVRAKVLSESASLPGPLRAAGILGTPVASYITRWFAPRQDTGNSEAYNLYFKGRYLWNQRTLPGTLQSIAQYEHAIELDPNFSRAYSALADAEIVLMNYNYAPSHDLVQKAGNYAQKALALGPDIPETYSTLAAIQQARWEWAQSESSYQHALQLSPDFALARQWHAGLLLQTGNAEAAIMECQRALNSDPNDVSSQSNYGLYLFYAGRPRDAQKQFEQILAQTKFRYADINLGDVYAILGLSSQGSEATNYFRKALAQAEKVSASEADERRIPGTPASSAMSDRMYASYYALMGDAARSAPYLKRLEDRMHNAAESPASVAEVYASLGDTKTALQLLQSAAMDRDRRLQFVKLNPFFRPLHDLAGFRQLITTIGL